eukprot:scaffold9446_cov72-Skeletonema_dohrnii-CCMP3373.AAC.5
MLRLDRRVYENKYVEERQTVWTIASNRAKRKQLQHVAAKDAPIKPSEEACAGDMVQIPRNDVMCSTKEATQKHSKISTVQFIASPLHSCFLFAPC